MNVTESGIYLDNHDVMPFGSDEVRVGEVDRERIFTLNWTMLEKIEEVCSNRYYTERTGDIGGVSARLSVDQMTKRIMRAEVAWLQFIDMAAEASGVGREAEDFLQTDEATRIRESLAAKNRRRSLR